MGDGGSWRETMGFDGGADVGKERKASQGGIRVSTAHTRLVILSTVAPYQDSSPRCHPRYSRDHFDNARDRVRLPSRHPDIAGLCERNSKLSCRRHFNGEIGALTIYFANRTAVRLFPLAPLHRKYDGHDPPFSSSSADLSPSQ